jgi:hypothetical protein
MKCKNPASWLQDSAAPKSPPPPPPPPPRWVGADAGGDTIAWYENVDGGGQTFATHTIYTSANGAFSVFAIDVDGDDDVDVLSASAYDDKIAW